MNHRLTLDALGKGVFGFEFHALRDQLGKYAETWERIMAGITNVWFILFPWLDYFAILIPSRRRLLKSMDTMNEVRFNLANHAHVHVVSR